MKYYNIASKIRYVYVFFHIVCILVILSEWLIIEDVISSIIITICLLTCIIISNILFFTSKDFWFITYILENKVKQKSLINEKEILYEDVNYMFFIDNLLVLSKENKNNYNEQNHSNMEKNKIIKELKSNVIIWLNFSDESLPRILKDKCYNAQVIKIGKIHRSIIKKFEI